MRIIFFCFLSIFIIISPVLAEDFIKQLELGGTKEEVVNNWTNTLSNDVASVTLDLKEIDRTTTKEETSKILSNVLKKIEKIKEDARKYNVVVEGFS